VDGVATAVVPHVVAREYAPLLVDAIGRLDVVAVLHVGTQRSRAAAIEVPPRPQRLQAERLVGPMGVRGEQVGRAGGGVGALRDVILALIAGGQLQTRNLIAEAQGVGGVLGRRLGDLLASAADRIAAAGGGG